MTSFYWHGHRVDIYPCVRSYEYTFTDAKGVVVAQGSALMVLTSLEALVETLKVRVYEMSKAGARATIPLPEQKDAPPRVRRKTRKPINLWK